MNILNIRSSRTALAAAALLAGLAAGTAHAAGEAKNVIFFLGDGMGPVTTTATRIKYLISFVLPRFCQQSLDRSWKSELYPAAQTRDSWVAKLDTIIHELYHIDPLATGIRQFAADGARSARTHAPEFYENVAAITRAYLASKPDPALLDFLRLDFAQLQARYGGVLATTFRNFPSFPQRYMAPCDTLSANEPAGIKIEPLKRLTQPVLYTERDLHVRQFTGRAAHRQTA